MIMTLASSPIDAIQSFAFGIALAFFRRAGDLPTDLFVICAFARDQLQSFLLLQLLLVQYFTEFCFIVLWNLRSALLPHATTTRRRFRSVALLRLHQRHVAIWSFVSSVPMSRRLLAILEAHLCARYIGFAFLPYRIFTPHLTSYCTSHGGFNRYRCEFRLARIVGASPFLTKI